MLTVSADLIGTATDGASGRSVEMRIVAGRPALTHASRLTVISWAPADAAGDTIWATPIGVIPMIRNGAESTLASVTDEDTVPDLPTTSTTSGITVITVLTVATMFMDSTRPPASATCTGLRSAMPVFIPGSIVTWTVKDAPGAIGPFGGSVTLVQPHPPLIDSIVTGASLVLVIVRSRALGCPAVISPMSSVAGENASALGVTVGETAGAGGVALVLLRAAEAALAASARLVKRSAGMDRIVVSMMGYQADGASPASHIETETLRPVRRQLTGIRERADRGTGRPSGTLRTATLTFMADRRSTIASFESKFAEIRSDSERAIGQLNDSELRRSLDGDSNSVAIIMKHVGGNLRSRFTDFMTSDGEKPWRDRENEFVDDFEAGERGRAAALAAWSAGWMCLETTLADLNDADLCRTVRIRAVPHSVALALARAVAHLGYHQGQITLIARVIVGPSRWKTISIPRGGTSAHHARMGFDPEQ